VGKRIHGIRRGLSVTGSGSTAKAVNTRGDALG